MSSSDNNTWTVMGIIFIVLTLGLGVGEYFTAKALQKGLHDSKTAQGTYEAALSKNQTLSDQAARLKTLIGYSGDMKTDDLVKDLEGRLTDLAGNSYTTCDDAIAGLVGEITARNASLQEANADRDQHYMTAGEEEERAKQQKADFDTEIDNITTGNKTQLQEAAERYDVLSGETVDEVRNVEQVKRTAAVNRDHLKEQTVSAESSVKVIADINANLRSKIEQLTDPFFEEADGKVVYVDQLNRVVRLNIGKDQGLRLLTKFAVFPEDALLRGEIKPKGAVEVVRFIGGNESDARIIDDEETLKNVIRSVDNQDAAMKILETELTDPISSGDLVYTPLWQKGERPTYALDYFLDVDNDGGDDLDLLVNIIEASDGVVSAWIDKNGELRGAVTPETNYLIVSNTPLEEALDASDLSDETKEAIRTAREKLLDDAELNGLREMKLNEFVRRSHFRQSTDVARFTEPGGLDEAPDRSRVPIVPNTNGYSVYNLNPEEAQIDPESRSAIGGAQNEEEEDGEPAPAFRRRTPKDI